MKSFTNWQGKQKEIRIHKKDSDIIMTKIHKVKKQHIVFFN
jgi:hypothetical protein